MRDRRDFSCERLVPADEASGQRGSPIDELDIEREWKSRSHSSVRDQSDFTHLKLRSEREHARKRHVPRRINA